MKRDRYPHILPETVAKCLKSDTLYACSIRHSYEDNPLLIINPFRSILRQYYNVREKLDIGLILRGHETDDLFLVAVYIEIGNREREILSEENLPRLPPPAPCRVAPRNDRVFAVPPCDDCVFLAVVKDNHFGEQTICKSYLTCGPPEFAHFDRKDNYIYS